MGVVKLQTTDAFVVRDVDTAERAVGIVRLAPKILRDGATLLARSVTYQYAAFGHRVSGASAGINAGVDTASEAVAAFAAELTPEVQAGRLTLSAGKGVPAGALDPLAAADPWGPMTAAGPRLAAASVLAAAAATIGGLEGRTVAIEGLDVAPVDHERLLAGLAERGARLVAVGTASGSVHDPAGLDPAALAAALDPAALAAALDPGGGDLPGPEPRSAAAVLGVAADLLLVGSKSGVIDHQVASGLEVGAIVPIGAVPVTAKGLAVARRAGIVVQADFVATAGPVFGSPTDDPAAVEAAERAAVEAVSALVAELRDHPDGPLLGACERAEAFLSTWLDELPFGRPLA